ncbi:MAG: tRNA (adenosine(37)-N6)-dimethylallyltransferase MiaA [Actinobacteria bacterium]|uniref:tRNA dimethylallyltransferase n=1 Tax=freshwater metagenome TaxID=449393 RepID=A0A6J7FJA3_9ZZZZ|nr:tRNA (adenosine(37)-N6)-dimethylallyltransferase MiaA [Actinomycetota bacterium]
MTTPPSPGKATPQARGTPLVAIVGATGTGKTSLSLVLAQTLAKAGYGVEIVNADAMQIYRGMDIGTAKLPESQREGIPHHLIDVCDVTEEASVSWYQTEARACIRDIVDRGNVPVLVGGSGLYISAVLFDFDFPVRNDEVRARLESEARDLGSAAMFERLRAVAPETASRIDARNERRVIRALEVVELGANVSDLGRLAPQSPPPAQAWLGHETLLCHVEREELVGLLDKRVDDMWANGFLDEVGNLIPRGIERGVTAGRAIGYAQALAQLRGESTEAEAVALTKNLTRRYARRQVSWFKRYETVHLVSGGSGSADAAVRSVLDRVSATRAP